MEELWMYCYDTCTKLSISQWQLKGTKPPLKRGAMRSKDKTLAINLFDEPVVIWGSAVCGLAEFWTQKGIQIAAKKRKERHEIVASHLSALQPMDNSAQFFRHDVSLFKLCALTI